MHKNEPKKPTCWMIEFPSAIEGYIKAFPICKVWYIFASSSTLCGTGNGLIWMAVFKLKLHYSFGRDKEFEIAQKRPFWNKSHESWKCMALIQKGFVFLLLILTKKEHIRGGHLKKATWNLIAEEGKSTELPNLTNKCACHRKNPSD